MLRKFIIRLGIKKGTLLMTLFSVVTSIIIYLLAASIQGSFRPVGIIVSILAPSVIAPSVSFILFRVLFSLYAAQEELLQVRSNLEKHVEERTQDVVAVIQQLKDEINQKKQIQEDLQRLSQRNDVALQIANAGPWEHDVATGLFTFDDRYYSLHGITVGEAGGYTIKAEPFIDKYIHPDDAPLLRSIINQTVILKKRGDKYEFEMRILRADASVRNVLVSFRGEKNTAGKYTRIYGVTQDITEHKRAQEALQESESQFKDLVEKSIVGVYLIQDNVIKYASIEFANISGYRVEEITGRLKIHEIIHPEDLLMVQDNIKDRISGKIKSLHYEFRILTKSKEVKHVEVYSSQTVYQGRAAIIGMMMDISERKNADETLRRLSFAVEKAAEDIVITDPDGIIQYVNPAFEKITGYSRSEAIGKTPRILKSGIHDRTFYEHLWTTIKEGNVWSGRITNRRKNGTLIQEEATISPLLTSSGKLTGYIALKRDITEAMKWEAQLRQAQKMEAIGTLAGGIAHDFNNILASLLGYTELAKFKTTDKAIHPFLDQILKACDRSKDLVKQILTFSRQREQEMKPLAVTPIIKEAMKLLRSSLPATVEIRQSFKAKSDTVLADPTQIHQIIMNLCTNAGHAMKDRQGVLEVRLDQHTLFQDGAELKAGEYLRLTIGDTGTGIDPLIKEKIFDPFFTTKKPGEGTGLGLSVVYGIVKDHGGSISVDSEVGKGTVFSIHLPLMNIQAEHENRLTAAMPEGNGHILYVDDEKPIASLAQQILESLGYQVTVRFSSLDALDAYRSMPERFDLVITDMTMPNMTGASMAMEMLKIRPNLPIILTTGYSEIIDEDAARKIGVREFLMKPVSMPQLAQAVKQCLSQ